MSTHDGIDDDIELNIDIPGLPSLAELTDLVRQQLLRDVRRFGNHSGKYAQRQLPQGVLKQVPGNQRIF